MAHRSRLLAVAALLVLPAVALGQDISEETVEFFQRNCASCHTIGGGRLAGPDLKDVGKRRDEAWLIRFVMDPKGVIDSGDAYAQNLLQEAKGVYMTPVPGVTRDRVKKLLELIEYESTQEKSRFVGLQISDRPLTDADIDFGRALFEGRESFVSGAPACISCHQVDGLGGLGGGRLGPDLTDVYSRLEGRKPLSAWLSAPPGLTMQPIYGKRPIGSDEVLSLVAYLKKSAETGQPQPERASLAFLLAGVVGVVLALIGCDLVWRKRFRAVRRPLVEGLAR